MHRRLTVPFALALVNTRFWSRDLGFSPPNSVGPTNGLRFRSVP
jgi:hypothetical protein